MAAGAAPDLAIAMRRRRLFAVFLLISVIAHAAVLGIVRQWPHGSPPPAPGILEVAILHPEPVPPPEPAVAASPPAPPETAVRSQAKPKHPARKPVKPRHRPPPVAMPEAMLEAPADEGEPAAAPEDRAPPVGPPQRAPSRASPSPKPGAAPVSAAAYLRNPAPRYPPDARRAGEQGTVTLRVLVAPDGSPARVNVETSSGWKRLDVAAEHAVRRWQFTPARAGGEAIESWVRVPIVFRLENPS